MRKRYVSPKKVQSDYFELKYAKIKKKNRKFTPPPFVKKSILRKKEINEKSIERDSE